MEKLLKVVLKPGLTKDEVLLVPKQFPAYVKIEMTIFIILDWTRNG